MKMLTPSLVAAAVALTLAAPAFAAEEQTQQQPPQREQEYLAALKKCDSLPQAERPKCIEAAQKKFGQM